MALNFLLSIVDAFLSLTKRLVTLKVRPSGVTLYSFISLHCSPQVSSSNGLLRTEAFDSQTTKESWPRRCWHPNNWAIGNIGIVQSRTHMSPQTSRPFSLILRNITKESQSVKLLRYSCSWSERRTHQVQREFSAWDWRHAAEQEPRTCISVTCVTACFHYYRIKT